MMADISVQDAVDKEAVDTAPRRTAWSTKTNKRTRSGCLNCRRKRRKCNEAKPTCEGCQYRSERCEWGVKVSFKPEHASTIESDHPSMRQGATSVRSQRYKIIDVTPEVIRDYLENPASDTMDDIPPTDTTPSTTTQLGLDLDVPESDFPLNMFPTFENDTRPRSSQSQVDVVVPTSALAVPDLFLSPQYSDTAFEDGIFLPGSQYQELHATLRSRLMDTARSTVPSRMGSPELPLYPPETEAFPLDNSEDEEFGGLAQLSLEREFVLWQNYIDEVAGWMDKFDINRHFELVLPIMARSHPHLRYSILALSAAQMERKAQATDNSCSLALYQHAIHLLSPLLEQRTTVVLASCVVLCVLEMMSCSPKAWRRHLDGCAALIQALGVSGGSGGLEQALFWCFARMDLWGGLISSEKTLIPIHNWIGGQDIVEDVAILMNSQCGYDMYANHVVYLCGQVIELLCSSGKWEQRRHNTTKPMSSAEYLDQWSRLFELLDRWYVNRPEEMTVLVTVPSPDADPTRPFPTLLYGNGPATSGNQMYHTAALLMLKYKPSHIQFAKKPPSMLWHARQVCAISVSNRHHGCWTNSIQPLWIAGQYMSHPSEHRVILEIYERIEREIGWATRWRAEDLKEYWGEEG